MARPPPMTAPTPPNVLAVVLNPAFNADLATASPASPPTEANPDVNPDPLPRVLLPQKQSERLH